MNALRRLRACALLLPLLLLLDSGAAQVTGEECLARFKEGKEDFILDVDESVKDGATFISSPPLTRSRDCVASCCKDTRCDVVVMKTGAEEGQVTSCFLFSCLYKQQYVCRFVRKKGYINYILDSVYDMYLKEDANTDTTDRPPVANGGLDRVIQPQDSLTLNGITSKDDQKIESYNWQLLTPYPHAVIERTNFDDQIVVSNLTSGVYKFQLTVTDSIGQSDSTTVTILVLTPEQSEDHCMVPMKVGPCRGSFPRWHYNAASEQCEQFNFGGCRGNRNNYLTLEECTTACYGTERNEKTGRGLPIPTPHAEKCGAPCTLDQFTCANQCCLDRTLECDKTPQCSDGSDEQNCENLGRTFEILRQIPVDEQKVRCTEVPDTGSCRDSLSKWYYNPVQQECLLFNYGGCHGNENRFNTKEQCMKVCRGVTEKDVFERKGSFEAQTGSETGIIAIAAILGLAILILLCILVYCLLRGKKKTVQHHRVPVNTMPVTIEDRERLVYNSTTKPI